MADEQAVGGSANFSLRTGRSQVVWNAPTGYQTGVRRTGAAAKTVRRHAGKRLEWWIVRSIVVATTVFALLDLFLLATGSHH